MDCLTFLRARLRNSPPPPPPDVLTIRIIKRKKISFRVSVGRPSFYFKKGITVMSCSRSRRRTRKHSATSPTLPCAASPPGSHVFSEPSDGRNKNKKRLKGMMVEERYGGGGGRGV